MKFKQIIMKRLFLLTLCVLLGLSISAYDFQIGDLCYSIISTSERTVMVEANSTPMEGDVIIPSVVTYNDVDFTVTYIAKEGFAKCYGITSFSIPNTVSGIGSLGFGWCWYLETIILDNPSSSFFVGSYAFDYDWRAFKTVRIINIDERDLLNNGAEIFSSLPTHELFINENKVVEYEVVDGVETINTCFKNCNTLEKLKMPNSVKRINNSAFYGCTALNTITLSSNLKEIGIEAFAECPELRTIYSKSSVPPSIDVSTFPNGAYMFATVYVPKGNLSAYKNAKVWKDFANIEEFEYDDVPDYISNISGNSVLIQSQKGILSIIGVADGTDIAVYSASGYLVGKAKACGAQSIVTTNVKKGEIVIVRIGEKSMKVLMN